MKTMAISLLFWPVLAAVSVQAQPSVPRTIELTIGLDRTEYFPGELIRATVSIRNNGPNTETIPSPFVAGTGEMILYQKSSDGKTWVNTQAGMHSILPRLSSGFPTQPIGSSEKIERKLRSDQPHFGTDPKIAYPQIITPWSTGDYSVGYSYAPHTRPEFTVVPAMLQNLAYVPLQKPLEYGEGNQNKTAPREVSLAVLGDSKGMHHIVISCSGHIADHDLSQYPLPKPLSTSGDVGALRTFMRIASSNSVVTSLQGVADADENVTVTYTTADGHTSTVHVSSDRESVK
jgi:hypothetical protein